MGTKRASNKVIWNMTDCQDFLDLARDEWDNIIDYAEAKNDLRLMMAIAKLGRYLTEIEQRVNDARNNRYQERRV